MHRTLLPEFYPVQRNNLKLVFSFITEEKGICNEVHQ